ncbi:hypothetical protein MMC34_001658 [Xylographa carneopallida]|nr:hypothetical protein [Xylographa carneopallida]
MAAVYHVPPGGLYVPDPRTVVDIVARSLAIHCFAVCAYAHFSSLIPWALSQRWVIVQMVLFMLLPELAVMQVPFVVLFIVFARRIPREEYMNNLRADLSETSTKLSLLGGHGQETFTADKTIPQLAVETDSEKQLDNSSQHTSTGVFPLLFIITTSVPLILTVLAYKQRLGVTYMAADYVGNLGLDHRNAWVSIGGLVAITGSVAVLFLTRPPTSKVALSKTLTPNLNLESHAPGLILCQAATCSTIHHVLLAATNHITLLSYTNYFGSEPLFAISCAGVLVYRRKPKWRIICKVVVRCLATLFVVATVGTQLFSDAKELHDVSESRVLPYNYRWKVKDWG